MIERNSVYKFCKKYSILAFHSHKNCFLSLGYDLICVNKVYLIIEVLHYVFLLSYTMYILLFCSRVVSKKPGRRINFIHF